MKNAIIVMSENTYKNLRESILKNANKTKDPIEYISRFSKTKIVMDNEVPDGLTEVWDEDDYWNFIGNNKGDNKE